MTPPPGKGDLFPPRDANEDGDPVDENLPDVRQKMNQEELRHFVTTIRSAEGQIGENILSALRSDDCVAVLTTIVVGPDGRQRVVSAALDASRMQMVQDALGDAERNNVEDVPCVGFHCYVRPKSAAPAEDEAQAGDD